MQKAAIFVFLLIISAPVFADLKEWDIDISINEDRTTDWIVKLVYDEPIQTSDYFVFSTLTSYSVTADENSISCDIQRDTGTLIGSSIICDGINARNITYEFSTEELVTPILQNFFLFSHRIQATHQTEKFRVTVRLPLGSVLADPNRLAGAGLRPFEPQFGQQSSDGRRIYVTWALSDPKVGDVINIAVVYEQLGTFEIGIFSFIVGFMLVAFIAVLYYFISRRRPVKDLLPVLNEGERKVMEIILREREVDQRQIVKETDFSKAKVSRIIKDLVGKGIVDKVEKGRKNLIRVNRDIKQQKQTKKENHENKGEI